jgi:hypothetical protein
LLKERGDFVGLLLQYANVFDLLGKFRIFLVKSGCLVIELKRLFVMLGEDGLLGFT